MYRAYVVLCPRRGRYRSSWCFQGRFSQTAVAPRLPTSVLFWILTWLSVLVCLFIRSSLTYCLQVPIPIIYIIYMFLHTLICVCKSIKFWWMRQVKSNITVLFLLIFNLIMYKWRSTIIIFQIFNNKVGEMNIYVFPANEKDCSWY